MTTQFFCFWFKKRKVLCLKRNIEDLSTKTTLTGGSPMQKVGRRRLSPTHTHKKFVVVQLSKHKTYDVNNTQYTQTQSIVFVSSALTHEPSSESVFWLWSNSRMEDPFLEDFLSFSAADGISLSPEQFVSGSVNTIQLVLDFSF